MSAKLMERFEILFRRQLALEWTVSARTRVIRKIDAIGPAAQDGVQVPDAPQPAETSVRSMPEKTLHPSAGWYNIARVAENGAVWLIVVDVKQQQDFRQLLMSVCNVQSMRRNFRPVFVLPDERNVELMRQFGLTFEVLTDPSYGFGDADEQIAHISAKWGVSMRLDIGDSNLLGDMRPVKAPPALPAVNANAAIPRRRSARVSKAAEPLVATPDA
jgi:hypothetical protein